MAYFVTGATGFIGRYLVERLLARGERVFVLVRPQSMEKFEALREFWGARASRVVPIAGDLAEPNLGVSKADLRKLTGKVDHLFHLAAIYDLQASGEEQDLANIVGTDHALQFADSVQAGCFHHASSIAAAGLYKGSFRENMFEEATGLDHPYFRTKHESEALVRNRCKRPWRVYRPGIVVGHSQTGQIDKIDGPYYFFKMIQKLRQSLPPWFPLIGLEGGYINLVPVDYVVAAMDHLAHLPGQDGQCFHLTDPRQRRVGEVLNLFARAGPRADDGVPARPEAARPDSRGRHRLDGELPAAAAGRRHDPARPAHPARRHAVLQLADALRLHAHAAPARGHRHPRAGARGLRLAALGLLGAPSRPGPVARPQPRGRGARQGRADHRRVLGHRARGGRALRRRRREGHHRRARSREAGGGAREARRDGGTVFAYACDIADYAACDGFAKQVLAEHGGVDLLVNNAGRSIRRSIDLSYDRFHDFERTMQLNYFAVVRLTMALMPSLIERGGHVVNISSIGVLSNAPRFSAYVSSKAAMEAWTRCAAAEYADRGVTFTIINMPLVRTPMIAPTKIYDQVPVATPEEAADMVAEAITDRPKRIATRLGIAAEVLHLVAPRITEVVMNTAYRMFPDSAAAKGEQGEKKPEAPPTKEAVMFASILRGVHW